MNIITKLIKQILKLIPILIIIGVGIYLYQINKNVKVSYDTKVEVAKKGRIENYVSLSGQIKPERQVNLVAKQTQTKVNELLVTLGDKVTKDQVLAKFATNVWADRQLVAPIDGIVTNLNLFVGETPSYQQSIITINSEKLYAELEVSEYDINKIQLSQKVNLHFDNIEKVGTVSEIALNPTATTALSTTKNVTYTVKITLDDQTSIRNGFTFDADIVTASKDNVLKISSSALKSSGNKNQVEIEKLVESKDKDGNVVTEKIFETRNVEIGINNDTEAEIISGVSEGEKVVLEKTEVKSSTGFNPFNR